VVARSVPDAPRWTRSIVVILTLILVKLCLVSGDQPDFLLAMLGGAGRAVLAEIGNRESFARLQKWPEWCMLEDKTSFTSTNFGSRTRQGHAAQQLFLPTVSQSRSPDDCFSLTETITTDADDHAAGLQHWQQEYHQLSGGRFHGTLNEIWFGNIQLFREQTNQVIHETGRAWEGSRSMGIPIAVDGEGVFCGSRFTRDSVLTMGHGDTLDFRTPKSLDMLAVTVDAEAMREYGLSIWDIDVEDKIGGHSLLTPPSEMTRQSRDFLLVMLSKLMKTPRILNYPQTRRGVEQEIYNNLITVVGGSDMSKAELPVISSRKALVAQAKEYVVANPEEPVMVADLCRALKVSRRTLQYSFQSVHGVNPVSYLRAVRLNGVRRMLKQASGTPGANVADIAARWGFWHLSHFASDYKALFDELPSQTLRKNTGAA
jgi:AraC family transcriptional regulator, ethanolamine operon transcriptional activator